MFLQKGEASTMHLLCYNYLFDVCVRACVHVCTTAHLWRSEDDLYELTLYFQYLNPRARTQVSRLSGRGFYPLSHFAGPPNTYLCRPQISPMS